MILGRLSTVPPRSTPFGRRIVKCRPTQLTARRGYASEGLTPQTLGTSLTEE